MLRSHLPSITPLGDAALLLTFGHAVDRALAARVRSAAERIRSAHHAGVTDVVPAYTTVAVYFDPAHTSMRALTATLAGVCAENPGDVTGAEPAMTARMIEIPVWYDGADIGDVAVATGLSVREVIERHSAPSYYAYLLGFVPGFAYLGDLDPALVLPRRVNPRQRVPAGAVAIAGAQTAVYPLSTPGGWHLIGSTRAIMFDPSREPPTLIGAGDRVRFVPVRQ